MRHLADLFFQATRLAAVEANEQVGSAWLPGYSSHRCKRDVRS